MGEDTIQFASRFSTAVGELAELAEDDGFRGLAALHGPSLGSRVGADLDAIEAVYETGTNAVRNWAEQRRCVLAQLGKVREALGRAGPAGEVRAMARALVEMIQRGRSTGEVG